MNYGVYAEAKNTTGYGILESPPDASILAYGGYFKGVTGPIVLEPSTSAAAPSHSARKGTLWLTSAGSLYVNTSGSTTWHALVWHYDFKFYQGGNYMKTVQDIQQEQVLLGMLMEKNNMLISINNEAQKIIERNKELEAQLKKQQEVNPDSE